MTVRRLLLLLSAGALVGCEPDRPSAPPADAGPPWFVECAAARGLDFVHASGHREAYLMPEIMCGGAALADVDGDGDLDAYLVQSGSLHEPGADGAGNRLYVNDGAGAFTDATDGSGADDRGYGMGVTTGDYDGDGDVDLYVTNFGANVLLENDGAGVFTNVTERAGVGHDGWGTSAAFLDYDHDGDLDLYVANYLNWSRANEITCFNDAGGADYCSPQNYNAPAADVLYRNDGDGTFTDVTEAAGLLTAFGTGLGVVTGDFDGNGWVDLFIANDGMPDQLWINQGDGTFRDDAMVTGVAIDMGGSAKAGMGVATADLDEDGDLDLLVVNLRNETDSLYLNHGHYFEDRTADVGLASASRPFTRFGLAFVDFDQDGRLDLYQANGRVQRQSHRYTDDPFAEPNLLFRGTRTDDGAPRFQEVRPRGGTDPLLAAASRGIAFGDVDGDGAIDALVVNRDGPAHLLRNVAPDRGHWIMVRAIDESGADALGATVHLTAGDRDIRREVHVAYGYCSANDPRVHVGLGAIDAVDDVEVRWVDGTVESFGPAAVDGVITVRRGAGTEVRP